MKKWIFSLAAATFLFANDALAQQSQRTLQNPLTAADGGRGLSLTSLVLRVAQWFTPLLGVISLVFVIIGGLEMALSGGSEDKIASGKRTVLFAILGLIIAFGGFVLVPIILEPFSPTS